MKIVPQEDIQLEDIKTRLKSGQVIVYPTETCYGLGCDSSDRQAVKKLYRIKQRRKDKPVLTIMSGIDMAQKHVHWEPKLQQLAEKCWPGALTLVAQAKPNADLVEPQVIASDGTLAFRVSSHPLSQQIVKAIDKPVVSTSANISSQETPYEITKVKNMFSDSKHQPDLLIDGGSLQSEPPSTIAKVEEGQVKIIRQGEVIIGENF